MVALIFICPQTGRQIETGIETDEDTLARVQRISMRVQCEHCGRQHQFHVEDGRLSDAA